MKAELITIGDEILIGQIVDTNSAWMASKLTAIGVKIVQITSISDRRDVIVQALEDATKRANLVLITGGLGPTKDDVTKQALCEYFSCDLRRDSEVLAHVESIFERSKRPMLPINQQQADVLSICNVLFNELGTAPGMWITQDDVHYVVMPGVPFEMKHLMETKVLPRVSPLVSQQALYHHTFLTAGLGESYLAAQISAIEDALPDHIRLAYLPQLGAVRLRLSGEGDDERSLREEVDAFADQIRKAIGEHYIAKGEHSLIEAVFERLLQEKRTVAFAESCTGGNLAHQLTRIPGSSAVFLGSCVAYANEAKMHVLGVGEDTLRAYGAVSEQTVREMAEGARRVFQSDYAVATSGVAGPGGGTDEKPVGCVWIAVAGPKGIVAKNFQYGKDRIANIERATQAGFYALWQMLNSDSAGV